MTDGLKHPVAFLGCDGLKRVGLAAMSFGFIAEILAVFMILFHALALVGVVPAKPAKVIASLVWLVLVVGFLIVCALAESAYSANWTCNNPFIPKLKISDHFNFNYGFAFAVIGYVSSVLIFTGIVSLLVVSMVVLGVNGQFDDDEKVDPTINP